MPVSPLWCEGGSRRGGVIFQISVLNATNYQRNFSSHLCYTFTHCPNGKYFPDGQLMTHCPSGKYCPNGKLIIHCPSGKYCLNGQFLLSGTCPNGKYCPNRQLLKIAQLGNKFKNCPSGQIVTDMGKCKKGFVGGVNES